jgi:hypothetical protein
MKLKKDMRTLRQVEADYEMDQYYLDLYSEEEYLEDLKLYRSIREEIRFFVNAMIYGLVSSEANRKFFHSLSIEDKKFYVFYRDMVRALGI